MPATSSPMADPLIFFSIRAAISSGQGFVQGAAPPPLARDRDRELVARQAGRDQRTMARLRAVVHGGAALERGQRAAGFLHDDIGGGEVPVVTALRGERDLELVR